MLKKVTNVFPFLHMVVQGESMAPALKDGEHVLVRRKGIFCRKFSIGDIVVVRHPIQSHRQIVKRITSTRNKRYIVEGDNKISSQDSRSFGSIPESLILGKVVLYV